MQIRFFWQSEKSGIEIESEYQLTGHPVNVLFSTTSLIFKFSPISPKLVRTYPHSDCINIFFYWISLYCPFYEVFIPHYIALIWQVFCPINKRIFLLVKVPSFPKAIFIMTSSPRVGKRPSTVKPTALLSHIWMLSDILLLDNFCLIFAIF